MRLKIQFCLRKSSCLGRERCSNNYEVMCSVPGRRWVQSAVGTQRGEELEASESLKGDDMKARSQHEPGGSRGLEAKSGLGKHL